MLKNTNSISSVSGETCFEAVSFRVCEKAEENTSSRSRLSSSSSFFSSDDDLTHPDVEEYLFQTKHYYLQELENLNRKISEARSDIHELNKRLEYMERLKNDPECDYSEIVTNHQQENAKTQKINPSRFPSNPVKKYTIDKKLVEKRPIKLEYEEEYEAIFLEHVVVNLCLSKWITQRNKISKKISEINALYSEKRGLFFSKSSDKEEENVLTAFSSIAL